MVKKWIPLISSLTLGSLAFSIGISVTLNTPFVRADENNKCNLLDDGSVCKNSGIVCNNSSCSIYLQSSNPKASSSTSIFQNPKPTVVDTGNFKFKLLGCKASEDRVQCDLTVVNLTSLDRTLFVASKQLGGIRNTRISQSKTTLIDSNGASYIAEFVSFAGNSGAKTGQSYFTVYSDTTPKLSVVFTGVETPATIQRLDVVVGEYIKSEKRIDFQTLKYTVKPKVES